MFSKTETIPSGDDDEDDDQDECNQYASKNKIVTHLEMTTTKRAADERSVQVRSKDARKEAALPDVGSANLPDYYMEAFSI